MRKKVLATSWHPGGANAIVPVIKRLSDEKTVDVITVGHQYSEKIFEAAGINYKKIADYGLQDVSSGSMETLIKAEAPRLVLIGTSTQDENNKDVIEQTATLAAKKQNVLTLAVLDFWGNYSQRFNDIYTDTGEKFKFLPNKIAIMDQYAMEDMLSEGFDKNRLVITGNPHFDNLESRAKAFTPAEKQGIRDKIGLSAEVIFFYAASAWEKDAKDFGYWDLDNIQLINEAINELPGEQKNKVGIAIKLHPRVPPEDLDAITKYLNTHSNNQIKLVSGIGPQELALASDLTFTPASTIGIEAVYMGKPCISLQPGLSGPDFLYILTKNGIIPIGYTKQECKELVKRAILNEPYRKQALIEQASSFRTDGKATERVANLVYELLQS